MGKRFFLTSTNPFYPSHNLPMRPVAHLLHITYAPVSEPTTSFVYHRDPQALFIMWDF